MRFEVLQENLKHGVNLALHSISNKAQLPVLNNILIIAKNNRLELVGTDLELGIKIKIGAKIENEGAITVPAKMFGEFINSLPAGKIVIESIDETLNVSSGSYKASFQTISADEYPQFPDVDKSSSSIVRFEKTKLFEAIRKILYASAKDSMRPILTGVLFKVGKKVVEVVATDGFRLATYKVDNIVMDGDGFEVVVPSSAVNELLNISGDSVDMYFLNASNQVFFVADDVVILSQVLDGSFPNYKKIIPESFGTTIIINRSELMDGVMVSQVFAKNNSNILKWNVSNNSISIESESPEEGRNSVVLNAKVDGENVDIAFNGRFLLEFLQSIKGENIWIGVNDSLSPGAFREGGNDKFLYIVMPINL